MTELEVQQKGSQGSDGDDGAKKASFETFNTNTGSSSMGSAKNLDVIQDINVNLSMELGRTKISIRELLQLNQGSVIELDRMIDEHMDVLVNGTLIAHGEVVVIDERFGIRLTDVVSPVERVKKLT